MKVPTGLKQVSESRGFVTTKGPRGECFEWYLLVEGVWKATHILHGENWLLESTT